MTDKLKGLIFYSKNIKDNDLFIKILSSKDEIISRNCLWWQLFKKKINISKLVILLIIQLKKKRIIFPLHLSAEISRTYLSKIIDDKFKSACITCCIESYQYSSIVEGQIIKGFYKSVYKSNCNYY